VSGARPVDDAALPPRVRYRCTVAKLSLVAAAVPAGSGPRPGLGR